MIVYWEVHSMDKQKRKVYPEMTNQEYIEVIKKTFDKIEDNQLLRYFYILIPKLIEEWR